MKAWTIAFKDTLIRFRDRNGLLLMLVAPLVLAVISGAAFGGLTSSGSAASPITDIPFAIVNADRGEYGQQFTAILTSPDLAELLEPTVLGAAPADLDAAKAQVEKGELRAVVYIPPEFSDVVQGQQGAATAITLYTDPTSAYSPLIVQSIVEQIANGFNAGIVGARVSAAQLQAQAQALGPNLAQLPTLLPEVVQRQGAPTAIALAQSVVGVDAAAEGFNPLAYFAPSMAILFLMFTIFEASRSFLEEEREWTLQRIMTTPTSFRAILAGKIGGVLLTGILQLAILIGASALFFRLDWGHSLPGLALMVIATVTAAAALGAFITATARDEAQAGIIGSAVALVFAILGGNFIDSSAYPAWMQPLSKLTINRWALDGFTDLSLRGGGFADVALEITVLFGITIVLFLLALWRLPRRFVH